MTNYPMVGGTYMISAILNDHPDLYPLIAKILYTKGKLGLYQDYSYTFEFIYDDEGYDLGELTYHRLCQIVRFLQDGETIDFAYEALKDQIVNDNKCKTLRSFIKKAVPHARVLDLCQTDFSAAQLVCDFITKYGRGSKEDSFTEEHLYDFLLENRPIPIDYRVDETGIIEPDEYDVVIVESKEDITDRLKNIKYVILVDDVDISVLPNAPQPLKHVVEDGYRFLLFETAEYLEKVNL